VNEFGPQIVHSFARLGYLLPLLRRSFPKIMSYQRHVGGRQITIASKLAGESIAFTACSEFVTSQGRAFTPRWSAIHNFVDTDYYRFQPTVDESAPLVFLSRIERIKGAHLAIAIARNTGRKLVLAGNRVDDEEGANYWHSQVEPFVDGSQIVYRGPVNDEQKNELLGQAAALIVPIEWDEPFGIVFAEALACGTPVISCARGALPEIITSGKHGFLISSLEEGIQAVQRLGTISRAECRRRAEEKFSHGVIVDKYESLYLSMKSSVEMSLR
jgi:glycosyltransferase involved in cell wall biosynthesis